MLFRPKCPVRAEEERWINKQLDWLVVTFGRSVLFRPVWLPTDRFFPGAYAGSAADVEAVLRRIADHMGVAMERIELVVEMPDDTEAALLNSLPLYASSGSGAAGHYIRRDGRGVVTIDGEQAREPMALVATIAHELGHERLIGEGLHDPDAADHEPLTDLLTVVFGLGVFAANSAFEHRAGPGSWRTTRLGYLTEPMWGYALGRYAWLRGEAAPEWATYLDTNPRSYAKKTLRYLHSR